MIHLDKTIQSLLEQSEQITKIVVNLPLEYDRFPGKVEVPDFLQRNPRVFVNRCTDYGPATKIIGLSRIKFIKPEDVVVVCDDDRKYDYDFVQKFVDELKIKPNCCVTNSGWETETISGYVYRKTNFPRGEEYRKAGYIDILGGCCGFALLYKNINFTEISKIDKNSPSYYVDDVWISGYLTVSGVKIWMLGNGKDAKRTTNDEICALSDDGKRRMDGNIYTVKYFTDKYGIWKDKTNE